MGVTQPPRPTSDAPLAQLTDLAARGVAPVATALLPAHAELVRALIAAHGDLAAARARAGLAEPVDRYPDRAQVIAALDALTAAGEHLAPRRLRELGEAALLDAAHALFGGLSHARRAAGLPAVLGTLPWFAPVNRPRKRWTAERVVDALADRLAAKQPVTPRALAEAGQDDLVAAIAAHVGTVDEAVRRARSMLRFRESTAAAAEPPRRVGRPPGRRPAMAPVPAGSPEVQRAAEVHALSVRQQMIEADLAKKAERDQRTVAALDIIAARLQESRDDRAARIAAAKAVAAAERAARRAERVGGTSAPLAPAPGSPAGAGVAAPVAPASSTAGTPAPASARGRAAADLEWAAAEQVRQARLARSQAALDAARVQLDRKRAQLAAAREARAREIEAARATVPARRARRANRPALAIGSAGSRPGGGLPMPERWAQFEREVAAGAASARLPIGLLTLPLEVIDAGRTELLRKLGPALMVHLERQAELLELAPPGPARLDLVRIVQALGDSAPVPATLQALVEAWAVPAQRPRRRRRSLEGLTPFRSRDDS